MREVLAGLSEVLADWLLCQTRLGCSRSRAVLEELDVRHGLLVAGDMALTVGYRRPFRFFAFRWCW